MKIKNLRCEYRLNPLGIEVKKPRLSWQIESPRTGARQTAYQVICYLPASSPQAPEEKTILWDSGKRSSDQSIQVPYAGPALESRQRVTWRVRIWDEHQQPTEWSEPAWFEMGLLSPGDWQAQWVGASLLGGPRTTAPCPYLRKNFRLDGQVQAARLYVTALGLYEAYLNGKQIGEDVFTPGWTDYRQRVQYQVYEVTDLITAGDNTLGAILGDGWYCGKLAWQERQNYGDRPRFYAQLEITLTSGERRTVVSDDTWETAAGPLLESDLIMGEAYDARLENPGWCAPSPLSREVPNGSSVWYPVLTFPAPKGLQLVAQNGPAVCAHQELVPVAKPVLRPDWPANTWIFDFGQNLVGRVRLKVKGERGKTVTLRFGETLDEDGGLYTQNLRTARQTDYYTLKGAPDGEVYESHFTFHGFRYVELRDFPGDPTRESLTAVVLHSDNPLSLDFECSDPLVNQLQHNILWGWKGNSVDIPTDCPQRDERLGWTGDAQVFVKTATYLTDSAGFFSKWIQDMADAQLDSGAIPSVAPTIPQLAPYDGGPAWSDAFIILPWTLWQQYGDTRLVETHYEAMCRYLGYLVDNSPGYIRMLPVAADLDGDPANEQIGGYGDWLAKDGGSDNRRGLTPKDLIGTAFLAYDAALMAQMAAAIGKAEGAARFEQLYTHIRQAFIQRFITPDGYLSGLTQTAYVLALYFDLLPDHQRPTVIASLVKDIEVTHKMHISTGFVGTPYICQVLTDAGRLDLAYALLLQKTYPSWLYAVVNGATTIWERWDGWTEDRGFQDPGMNSFNHYAYGAIGTWMVENIAGIQTDGAHPGFKHILLTPRPGGDLTYARGTYHCPYGLIESSWQIAAGTFTWEVVLPPNTTATAYLPADPQSRILVSGLPVENAPGVDAVRRESGYAVLQLQSGHFRFEVLVAAAG